jgi:MFS family permease
MNINDAANEGAPASLSSAATVAVLVACVAACYGFGLSLFPQIVPDMRADLGFDYVFVGTTTALVQFSTVVFAILAAWFSPRVGAAQVVIASVTLCSLCLLAIPLSGNTLVVGALLALIGGSGASTFVPMINLVSRTVSPGHRGFVMSVVSSAPAYGVVVNSLLVPNFAGAGHWQTVWYIVGSITALLVLIAIFTFHRAGLFAKQRGDAEANELSKDRGGIRAAMPWVLLIWALSFFNGLSPYPYLGFLSPYLREELGYSVSYAGWLWGMTGIVGIFAGFLAGAISSRVGTRAAILFCYVNFLVAGLLMFLAPTPALAILAGALFSLGFYPIYGLLPAYVSHRTSAVAAVTIFGISTVVQGIGGASGNYLGGMIKSASDSFSGIYLAFAAAGAFSIILTITLPRQTEP